MKVRLPENKSRDWRRRRLGEVRRGEEEEKRYQLQQKKDGKENLFHQSFPIDGLS